MEAESELSVICIQSKYNNNKKQYKKTLCTITILGFPGETVSDALSFFPHSRVNNITKILIITAANHTLIFFILLSKNFFDSSFLFASRSFIVSACFQPTSVASCPSLQDLC